MMTTTKVKSNFTVQVAVNKQDLKAAQRLRYDIFVQELGANGPMVDHDAKLEQDRFDPFATHLLLRDLNRPGGNNVVGVYRLLTDAGAAAAGQFYCEDEYDLAPLKQSGKRLLELGRSCLHRDYRGGASLMYLWRALADFVAAHNIDILFGVASFHGTDTSRLAAPLSMLHHHHLATADLRVTAKGPTTQRMDLVAKDQIDRRAALRDTPALIRAYLRQGGVVGAGAFVDHAFNTTDVCLILPPNAIGTRRWTISQNKCKHDG